MPSLTQAIVNGSLTALRMVRQFLSNPIIIYQPQSKYGIPVPPQVVVMEARVHKETLSNQASKMLLVDVTQGKSYVNDNIAPMPRVWRIEGYLFPLLPLIPATDQIQFEVFKQTLRDAANSRQLVQFKPATTDVGSQFGQAFQSIVAGSITGTISVVILDLEFDTLPEVQNKAPFTMMVQEIDTLTTFSSLAASLSQSPDGSLTNPYAAPASNALGVSTFTQGSTAITGAVP